MLDCGDSIIPEASTWLNSILHHYKDVTLQFENQSAENVFADNHVIIVLTHEASLLSHDYGPDDFPEINCEKVRDLTGLIYQQIQEKLYYLRQDDIMSFDASGNMPERLKSVSIDTYQRILCLELMDHGKEAVLGAIDKLTIRADVQSAEPDYKLTACSIYPNDPLFQTEQWGHNKIQLPQAWDTTTGSSAVLVGVIDSGIDSTHSELSNRVNVSLSRDFHLGDEMTLVGSTDDPFGHGTKVAGIIGAQGNNNNGITGACWNVTLVSLRVLDEYGSGLTSDVAQAIFYAQYCQITILNLSCRWYYSTPGYTDSMETAISQYSGLLICSAGNEGLDNDQYIELPGAFGFANVITVGASSQNDTVWEETIGGIRYSSNYGLQTVDIFAPGESIYTCLNQNGSYGYSRGTSIATPYVTGVAALLRAVYPGLTAAMIRHIIIHNADVVYDNNENVFGDICVSGGRLNAYNSLSHASSQFQYSSLGVHIGHKCSCTSCYEMLITAAHNWLQRPGGWICGTCGQWTNAIPTPLE